MSDAPERISLELRQGLSDDFWSECRDPRYAKSEPVAYVRADRIEAREALLREAMAWLADFADAKFDAVQTHRAAHPADEPDPVTDAETVWAYQDDARATLAKLRAHLEDSHAE